MKVHPTKVKKVGLFNTVSGGARVYRQLQRADIKGNTFYRRVISSAAIIIFPIIIKEKWK